MTYRELQREGIQILRERGITDAAIDAQILLEHVIGLDRAHFLLREREECPDKECRRYRELIARRAEYVPVQHLTGVQEFMGYSFLVNEHVLIPRQDTELLVLEAERHLYPGARVLDLCTGSGCVIISLAKRQSIEASASDISPEALKTARANAERLIADVTFVESDLFAHIRGTYDCIVSNPPYIRSAQIPELMPEVRDHEPRLALDGQADGLFFYRRIVREAKDFLRAGGWLLFEIGFDQGEAVMELMRAQGYESVAVQKDLAGLDRVVGGRRERDV